MENVLVLNSDFTPINLTTLHRGFILVHKGKAEILKSGDNPIITSIGDFVRPLIIRLLNYVSFRPKTIKVNRHRIYRRDGNKCVYCGSKHKLTIDHVLPKSRGGGNTWDNLVTCCQTCNSFKGNRTPEEANMIIKEKPPKPVNLFNALNKEAEKVYNDFLKEFTK